MRLGAMVMTQKQNKHRASWKLLILQNQRRPDRFNQMWRSCWLVVLMLMELCTRNLFLLDKLWINNFICWCWKDYVIVYGKNNQKCGAVVMGSFTTTMPLHMTVIPHPPYSHDLAPCDFFLFPHIKCQMKGQMSAKWKRKCWESWTTSALKNSRNVFSSGKNDGRSGSSQKESTLKETRIVIV